ELRGWKVAYLPSSPLRFVLYFVANFKGWYLAILLFQLAAVACGVLVPWSLGQVTRAVDGGLEHGHAFAALAAPVAVFAALVVAEVLMTRGATGCHIRVMPQQRRRVTHAVFAYLQQHSHRFVSNEFAGALAHRVSDIALGVNQTLSILLFDLIPLAVTLALATVLLRTASPLLAGLMLGWSLLFLVVCYRLARRSHPLAQQHAAARSTSNGQAVDA